MAKFEIGHSKFGGRKPGSINKISSAKELFEDLGLDPLKELALLAQDPGLDIREKIVVLKELCPFAYAKPKQLTDGGALEGSLHELATMSEEELEQKIASAVFQLELDKANGDKISAIRNLTTKFEKYLKSL